MRERSEESAAASGGVLTGKWLNPANLMTALRVALAPPIILLLVYKPELPLGISWNLAAALIFLLAALTDKADGYYARKYDSITRLGEFLDPLADKLLMIPLMITMALVPEELLPLWVVIVVVARELVISCIRFLGARRGISFPASWSGKVKMFSQILVVGVILLFPTSASGLPILLLVYAMVTITVYSGVDYIFRARSEIFGEPSRNEGC